MEEFETILLENPGNSLRKTIEVVDTVLQYPERFDDLYQCYFSDNEWVRLRVSNAIKRVGLQRLDLLVPYIDHFLGEINDIDQPSTQWTLSKLYLMLENKMTPEQKRKAIELMKQRLRHDDWIVLNNTMETLHEWAKNDTELKKWLLPQLERLSKDDRKSVARRAQKYQTSLESK
jgi:hypothetical protein